jgi:hypothetical protein
MGFDTINDASERFEIGLEPCNKTEDVVDIQIT